MRININNSVFGKEEPNSLLINNSDNQCLSERNWVFKNEIAIGSIKDVRLKGVCFLAYNLSIYKNDEIFVTDESSLFKLHFELGEAVMYRNEKGIIKYIKKGRFDLLYINQNSKKTHTKQKTKNSVELFFDESYLKGILGNEFTQLLPKIKNKFHKEVAINNGFIITEEIISIINTIKNCEYLGDKRNVFIELKIKELIIVALAIYEDNFYENEELTNEKESLQKVEKHIKLNLKKVLNISDLSVLAAMNTSKFKKCFKQLYGTTVFKYITSLRIERAKVLIQEKSYTISQASYEVGYKNAQHFTVAFKKNMGYLPSELKRNIKY